jgi:hypothetical protein
MPLDTAQVVEGMEAYQALLPKLLKPSDWQSTGDGKFVKKSGWRKIARAFNLSVMVISVRIERDAEGQPHPRRDDRTGARAQRSGVGRGRLLLRG